MSANQERIESLTNAYIDLKEQISSKQALLDEVRDELVNEIGQGFEETTNAYVNVEVTSRLDREMALRAYPPEEAPDLYKVMPDPMAFRSLEDGGGLFKTSTKVTVTPK